MHPFQEPTEAMWLLNFSHPLTPEHVARVEELCGEKVEAVTAVRTDFQHDQPFAPQARALAESAGLTSEEWQTRRLLVNLPSLNVIACALLAELHGRMGYFPTILRMRPVPGAVPPQFEPAEIIPLQTLRDEARLTR